MVVEHVGASERVCVGLWLKGRVDQEVSRETRMTRDAGGEKEGAPQRKWMKE